MANWDLSLLPEEKFNKQTFDEYYTEYEQYLYTNKPVKYQIVAPLENFDSASNSSTIKLSNNVRIVPANSTFYPYIIENDRSRWMNEVTPEIEYYSPPGFFLEIDYEMEKEIVPSQRREHIEQKAREEMIKVMKILRLYKEGDISCGLVYWYPKTPCDPPYTYDDILFYSGNYSTPNKYSLQEDDIKRLGHLFQKCSSIPSKKDFRHDAIEYLNKGLRETEPTNRLREFISALECIFPVGKDEITFKLAIYTAFFLEENRKKCREIYNDIKEAYSLRSDIVHTKLKKVEELKCKECAMKTERYVRKAIIKLLNIEKANKKEDILNSILDKLFS